MVRAIAVEKGYFGGELREIGASFPVDDDIWNDEKRRPKWAKLDPSHAFGGKGDHDGDGSVGGSKPKQPAGGTGESEGGGAVTIPVDWQNGSAAERKALAKAITGQNVPNAAEADKLISAYVESTKPAPFSDAPAPETAGNGVQAALGTTQPDWVAPGHITPQAVED